MTDKKIRTVAAILSLVAGVIHAFYIQEHFEEWWGYGLFFLVTTIAQLAYAGVLVPDTMFARLRARWFYWTGIIGNALIVAMYGVTRTMGIPLFGPHVGEVEEVTTAGVASVVIELALIVLLTMLLRRMATKEA